MQRVRVSTATHVFTCVHPFSSLCTLLLQVIYGLWLEIFVVIIESKIGDSGRVKAAPDLILPDLESESKMEPAGLRFGTANRFLKRT